MDKATSDDVMGEARVKRRNEKGVQIFKGARNAKTGCAPSVPARRVQMGKVRGDLGRGFPSDGDEKSPRSVRFPGEHQVFKGGVNGMRASRIAFRLGNDTAVGD